ncbi:MerR family transcriptional regulator [Niallia sp. 03091]|uniref:MerR family transcriptional regulator n=1 Tax=Niallia sp. 03091 TaxID=3458059 RepID=UPI004044B0AE
MNEYGSFSKEVSELLNINANTLRRWSIELEKQGYVFERNEKEQRIYYKRDIVALRQLQKMISEKVPMVNACTKIASKYINNKELEQTLDVHQQKGVQIAISKEELQSMIEQAIEKERESMFKAFEAKLNDVVEKRDRILTQQLNRSMEERRLEIAAAQEEKEAKKSWWGKIFSK